LPICFNFFLHLFTDRVADPDPSVKSSVADPGCLSWIPNPDFYPSRIPDPKTATKDRGEKKFFVKPFFVATFHKTEYYFIFDMLKKKLAQFSKNYSSFNPKNCHQALKNMGLGSGIRKKPILDLGSRGQKGTGSRIRINNTVKSAIKFEEFFQIYFVEMPFRHFSS
jgi:hypothetical protein